MIHDPKTDVPGAIKVLDQFTRRLQSESAKLGKPMTCRAGCFHCCKEPLLVEKNEVAFMLKSITNPAEREELTSKARTWWKAFFSSGLEKKDGLDPKEIDKAYLFKYRQKNFWCPFLVGSLCSVYAARPGSCRMHIATGSPSNCAHDLKRIDQEFATTAETPQVVLWAMGALARNARKFLFRHDHLGVWLGHMLLGETRRSGAAQDYLVTQSDPAKTLEIPAI